MAFLVFEGLDGSGKSSLMNALESELTKAQIPFLRTREPGGTALGEEIRKLLLTQQAGSADQVKSQAPVPRAELLLYEASRAQHVDLVIKPALDSKKWVLCDRFSASSVAFQAGGRTIEEEKVHTLNYFATAGLEPDLTILLDLSVEVSELRRAKRTAETGEQADRIEAEAREFHERVRKSFLKQAHVSSQNWLVLDANNTPEKLKQQMLTALRERGWLGS